MKSSRLVRLLAPACWVAMISSLFATTHAVLPGGSIQVKINLAVDGDMIAIFGGTYFEDLVINKKVRLVEVSGQEVQLAGSVTFQGVTDCPPFVGFEVGPEKGITVNDCTGLIISGVSTPSITQNSGELSVTSTTIVNGFTTADAAVKTFAFRVIVGGDCNWRSNRAWFGYSKARFFGHYGANAKVVVIGSEIDRANGGNDGIQLHGAGSQNLVSNSVVRNVKANQAGVEDCIEVRGVGSSTRIYNNYLQKIHNTIYSDSGTHCVLRVSDATDVVFANNITSATRGSMAIAPSGVAVTNNHVAMGLTGVSGGVVAVNTTSGDPLFIGGDPYKLGEGSPCINVGTPDPRYNDRDGSRNNIGPSGGCWFDPDGWTTENPVVVSFDLLPDQVLEEVDTEIVIDQIRAASAP